MCSNRGMLQSLQTLLARSANIPNTSTGVEQVVEACKDCHLETTDMHSIRIGLSGETLHDRRFRAMDARVPYVPGP